MNPKLRSRLPQTGKSLAEGRLLVPLYLHQTRTEAIRRASLHILLTEMAFGYLLPNGMWAQDTLGDEISLNSSL